MKLYRTPKGTWAGTQADARKETREEGSKPGSWREVEVPTDKAGLLLFLNSKQGKSLQEKAPAPKPVEAVPRSEAHKAGLEGHRRYRVYDGQGLFVGATWATSPDRAVQQITERLEAREDKSK